MIQTTQEHADLLDWVGGEFNPEAFSVDDVNRRTRTSPTLVGKNLKRCETPPI